MRAKPVKAARHTVWPITRCWFCFNLTNIVLVDFTSHNGANPLYPINIKGHGWLRESNSQKHFYASSFYLQNIIPFPNHNCYSSLVMMTFEGILTGLPMLEQRRLCLRFDGIVVKSVVYILIWPICVLLLWECVDMLWRLMHSNMSLVYWLINSYVFEGPEKATRGGVNGSQSKFLTGIWPMSQSQPETPLF
jgi:hypothetical protein